jgi:OmpA-OmpF porin, OOP family
MKLFLIIFLCVFSSHVHAQALCNVDADDDGVADCFDKCPLTPKDARVDTKGCPKDTDGDGVADYMDKQLITQADCRPVNTDGIGLCDDAYYAIKKYDSIKPLLTRSFRFTTGSTNRFITEGERDSLIAFTDLLLQFPDVQIVLNGNGTSRREQQRSWARVKLLIEYFVSKGVNQKRFCFEFGQDGPYSSVDIFPTNYLHCDGIIPAPPSPNLK